MKYGLPTPSSGRSRRNSFCLPVIAAFLSGCASYQLKVNEARESLESSPNAAVEQLQPLAMENNKDQLVYLLDYATALQQAKRFKESAEAFQKAERIADIQDYHSVSKITTSLLLSEEMLQYKGDDFEKVMINAMNSINYLELGDLDGALVEVRRLNNKLYRYKYEAKKNYEQNPFAFYLSGAIWESDRKWDDAYIAYKNTYEVMPEFAPLREDLIRLAIKAQRTEDLEKWKKQFPKTVIRPEWKDPQYGEIVFVFQQGWGPRKQARPEDRKFPYLVPVRSDNRAATLVVEKEEKTGGKLAATPAEGGSVGIKVAEATTVPVFYVSDVAIKTLNDDYARLVASRVAGLATKAVVSDQIRQKNEALGTIAWVAMNIADRADLRQWSTLPETFQVARVFVKAGKYKVSAFTLNSEGEPGDRRLEPQEVTIKPGKKTFLSWRAF